MNKSKEWVIQIISKEEGLFQFSSKLKAQTKFLVYSNS